MAYYPVDPIDIESPVAEDLYELDDGDYVPSEDVYPDPEKTYYMEDDEEEADYEEVDVEAGEELDEETYELIGEQYVLTADTVAQAGKTYYTYTGVAYQEPFDVDSLYYVFSEYVANPSLEGLYEKSLTGEYFLTSDTEYDEDKVYYKELEPAEKPLIDETPSSPYFPPSDLVTEGIVEPAQATVISSLSMVYARTRHITDPNAAGLYEIVEGAYVLTADTELVKGKTYYEHYVYNDYYEADMTGIENPSFSLHKYYELVNNEYVPTSDTTVSALKAYYRSHSDDDNFYVPDPVISARASAS